RLIAHLQLLLLRDVRTHPRDHLFPYPTLFGSRHGPRGIVCAAALAVARGSPTAGTSYSAPGQGRASRWPQRISQRQPSGTASGRSEEHTSELQSRENHVCRLLLEKKIIRKIKI